MQCHVATSGWFYREWKGGFYPAELAGHRWFKHYAGTFDTVELNAPFYRWPKPETVKTWFRQSPENFQYCVKVNRLITHYKRFQDTQQLIRDFYQIAAILGPKMGCFLFQLPPNFEYTPVRLKAIVSQLDPAYKNVVEFRHASWWTPAVYAALKKHKIIFCCVSGPKASGDFVKTAGSIYIRFHGPKRWFYDEHPEEELDWWVDKIRKSRAREVWAYFNNTADASALKNAVTFKQKLLAPHSAAKKRV